MVGRFGDGRLLGGGLIITFTNSTKTTTVLTHHDESDTRTLSTPHPRVDPEAGVMWKGEGVVESGVR